MAKQDSFMATARKWRPGRFSELVGQDHVAVTICNAIVSGRIHHAYLFTGPRGVGKTTAARLLAKAVNCQNQGDDAEPCNVCDSCRDTVEGRSLDVVEIDGASNNSVEDVRKIRENAKYPPIHGKYKIYIIDEVHMLSTSAFNALLKTLEEPPPHLLFVFATTEIHKVPATIVSRCQRFDFRRMGTDSIVGQLQKIAKQEGVAIDEDSLAAIARKADGSMRDSQSIFDQVVAFCGNNVDYSTLANVLHLIDQEFFFGVSRAVVDRDVAGMFQIANIVIEKGYDIQECLNGLIEHFRNILTILATGNSSLIEMSQAYREKYEIEAAHFSQTDVIRIMSIISSTQQDLRFASLPRIRFELLLSQIALMDSTVEISELLEELRAMKQEDSGNHDHRSHHQQKSATPIVKETDSPTYSVKRPTVQTAEQVQEPVAPLPPKETLPIAAAESKTAVAEQQTPPEPSSFNETVFHQRWSDFLNEIQDKGLQLLLSQLNNAMRVECVGNSIVFSSQQRFHTKSCEDKIDVLQAAAEAVYGKGVRVEVMNESTRQTEALFDAPPPAAPPSIQGNPSEFSVSPVAKILEMPNEQQPPKKQEEREYNVVEKAIIDIFSAREIPLPSGD